jgi:hypothetical protein
MMRSGHDISRHPSSSEMRGGRWWRDAPVSGLGG